MKLDWTDEEISVLTAGRARGDNYTMIGLELPGRTKRAVYLMAQKLGLVDTIRSPRHDTRHRKPRSDGRGPLLDRPPDGPIMCAMRILGPKLRERQGMWLLEGRPTRTAEVLTAAGIDLEWL